jgi:hypothetical protein
VDTLAGQNVVPRIPFSWKQIRSFIIDGVLIGAAVSYASSIVQAWLLAHDRALCVIVSVLHIAILPMLTLSAIISGTPGAQYIAEKERSPLAHVYMWSYVLFFGAGFIVPGVFTLALNVENEALFFATIFGPYVAMALALWGVVRLDKKTNYRYSRFGAQPPRAFVRALVLTCWAYLLCLEAVMMLVVRTKEIFGGGGTLIAAFIGYLPVRLCIALAYDATSLELAVVGFAFLHFLYRLAQATP